jgi:streptomycin 6-kinase
MSLVPAGLRASADRGPEWATWLERLPGLARELLEDWALTLDGQATHGRTALVVPVRTTGGRPAMLKVGWPHWEAEHEALALQHWHGRGAVPLLRADPHRWALLLDRIGPEDLAEHWDFDACAIVGALYRQLHVPAPPQLRRLSDQARRWVQELGALDRSAPLPHRMVEHARALARDFAEDEACDGTLIHTDLHFENVLAGPGGSAGEWLAIDPKPLSGDPHYEIAPMLWNRFDDYAGRERDAIRDRFFALVDAAELDEDRARDWVIVRMLVMIKDELLSNAAPDRAWTSMMLTIAKAVQ